MEQTTALRKIANLKKKIKVIQGGQGAGKTIAILILLINHAYSKPNKEIVIASEELTKMRLTVIKDFVKIMKSFGIYSDSNFLSGTLYKFPNGSWIKFIGLDKEDVGKGLRSNVFYLNEANKVNFENYREIASRADKIYLDFNPNFEFWVHREIINREDCDFITLTFEDNEYLNQNERDEILRYKDKGFDKAGNVINKYWANKWRVYGLGQVGILEGAVFEDWEVKDIPEGAELLGYGMDFGFESPTAVVGVWYLDGHYYLDEVIYESKLTNQDAGEILLEHGITDAIIYADNAEPKSISEIYAIGLNIHPCDSKTDIRNYAIKKLQNNTFFVTSQSENLQRELSSLLWGKDAKGNPTGKPKKGNDHAIDATIYFIGTIDKFDGSY